MSATSNLKAAVDYSELIEALAAVHAQPLWDRYMKLATRAPQLRDPAHVWRWRDMLPFRVNCPRPAIRRNSAIRGPAHSRRCSGCRPGPTDPSCCATPIPPPARLFMMTDRELLAKIGYLREETNSSDSNTQGEK